MREAEGRLGPGNLEGAARKYAGPYPRAAKGEGAGEAGEHGANPEAAKRLEPRGHGAKRSPQGRNTAQALAQGRTKAARCARNRPK